MVKAVVFDWGGVLIEDPAPGLVTYCSQSLEVSEAEFKQAFQVCGPDFQTGRVTERDFWERICDHLNCSTPPSESLWGMAFRAVYRPRKIIFDLSSSLQKLGIKTAILSNTEVAARDYFRELGYTMFDVQVFSCDEGVAKPQAEIYNRTLIRLHVPPSEVVFIDDRLDSIAGARDVGIYGIHFQSTDSCLAKLKNLGVRI